MTDILSQVWGFELLEILGFLEAAGSRTRKGVRKNITIVINSVSYE